MQKRRTRPRVEVGLDLGASVVRLGETVSDAIAHKHEDRCDACGRFGTLMRSGVCRRCDERGVDQVYGSLAL
jgi:hypothetical protein